MSNENQQEKKDSFMQKLNNITLRLVSVILYIIFGVTLVFSIIISLPSYILFNYDFMSNYCNYALERIERFANGEYTTTKIN